LRRGLTGRAAANIQIRYKNTVCGAAGGTGAEEGLQECGCRAGAVEPPLIEPEREPK
jgi:hypothetical protein